MYKANKIWLMSSKDIKMAENVRNCGPCGTVVSSEAKSEVRIMAICHSGKMIKKILSKACPKLYRSLKLNVVLAASFSLHK